MENLLGAGKTVCIRVLDGTPKGTQNLKSIDAYKAKGWMKVMLAQDATHTVLGNKRFRIEGLNEEGVANSNAVQEWSYNTLENATFELFSKTTEVVKPSSHAYSPSATSQSEECASLYTSDKATSIYKYIDIKQNGGEALTLQQFDTSSTNVFITAIKGYLDADKTVCVRYLGGRLAFETSGVNGEIDDYIDRGWIKIDSTRLYKDWRHWGRGITNT